MVPVSEVAKYARVRKKTVETEVRGMGADNQVSLWQNRDRKRHPSDIARFIFVRAIPFAWNSL